MLLIQSEGDLHLLDASVASQYRDIVAAWYEAMQQDSSESVIVVVTDRDDPRTLTPLMAAHPEYAESLGTDGGDGIKKVVVMTDNEIFETWFVPKGAFPAFDEWVLPYLEE